MRGPRNGIALSYAPTAGYEATGVRYPLLDCGPKGNATQRPSSMDSKPIGISLQEDVALRGVMLELPMGIEVR